MNLASNDKTTLNPAPAYVPRCKFAEDFGNLDVFMGYPDRLKSFEEESAILEEEARVIEEEGRIARLKEKQDRVDWANFRYGIVTPIKVPTAGTTDTAKEEVKPAREREREHVETWDFMFSDEPRTPERFEDQFVPAGWNILDDPEPSYVEVPAKTPGPTPMVVSTVTVETNKSVPEEYIAQAPVMKTEPVFKVPALPMMNRPTFASKPMEVNSTPMDPASISLQTDPSRKRTLSEEFPMPGYRIPEEGVPGPIAPPPVKRVRAMSVMPGHIKREPELYPEQPILKSFDINTFNGETKASRGRGRPKGSKNKPKSEQTVVKKPKDATVKKRTNQSKSEFTWSNFITMAIMNAPGETANVRMMYDFVRYHFPSSTESASESTVETWRNTLRHTVCESKHGYQKVMQGNTDTKTGFWTFGPTRRDGQISDCIAKARECNFDNDRLKMRDPGLLEAILSGSAGMPDTTELYELGRQLKIKQEPGVPNEEMSDMPQNYQQPSWGPGPSQDFKTFEAQSQPQMGSSSMHLQYPCSPDLKGYSNPATPQPHLEQIYQYEYQNQQGDFMNAGPSHQNYFHPQDKYAAPPQGGYYHQEYMNPGPSHQQYYDGQSQQGYSIPNQNYPYEGASTGGNGLANEPTPDQHASMGPVRPSSNEDSFDTQSIPYAQHEEYTMGQYHQEEYPMANNGYFYTPDFQHPPAPRTFHQPRSQSVIPNRVDNY